MTDLDHCVPEASSQGSDRNAFRRIEEPDRTGRDRHLELFALQHACPDPEPPDKGGASHAALVVELIEERSLVHVFGELAQLVGNRGRGFHLEMDDDLRSRGPRGA